VTTRFVDAAGRVLSVTNALGERTQYTYDGNDQVRTVTDALGDQTAFNYFPDGQLRSVTDANQHRTNYTYDAMGRLANRTDPLQRVETFTYDLNGNPETWTDRKGQETTRGYDGIDRLHQITYADASTITYTYDERDRLTQIDDTASGSIGRTYDDFDRLTSETTLQGSVTYTYDDASRRATMTVGGQPSVTYAYDDADRLRGLTRDTLSVGITYDDANRRTTLTLPNGIVTEYGYDDADEVTSLTYGYGATTLGDLTSTYDTAGRRVEVGGSWARTGLPQAIASASYDAANELTSWSSRALTYDANGNLANDGLTSYTWNARNQLAGLSGGINATFAYDPFGRRQRKTVSGATTNFLYDGLNFVQELTAAGAPTANLLAGLSVDEIFSRTDAVGTSTTLEDVSGSALALADASGAIATSYTYDPFGDTVATGQTSAYASQFTGRENDAIGLYGYRARYYAPAMQRFVSEDPLGLSTSFNAYAYARNNPIGFTDPLGLQSSLPPGVTHHPPPEAGKWGCKGSDPCAVLKVKLKVAQAVQGLHKLIDSVKPGEHNIELPELQGAVDNCNRWITKKRCDCDDSPWLRPPTPAEQRQIEILSRWLAGATGALMMYWWVFAVV
jgi:RHS repeat-associated protein